MPLTSARIKIKQRHDPSVWHRRALCRVQASNLPAPPDVSMAHHNKLQSAHTSQFFPTRHTGPREINAARAVCKRCPVQADCLTYALQNWERGGGIWGGETEDERRVTRRRMRKCGVRASAKHETAKIWVLEHLFPTTPEEGEI